MTKHKLSKTIIHTVLTLKYIQINSTDKSQLYTLLSIYTLNLYEYNI